MTLTNLEHLRLTIQDKLKMKADEIIGLGDGIRNTWILEMQPIKAATAIITVNGVTKTLTTDYTLDLETGLLEFGSGDIPKDAEVILAISYGYFAFSDDELNTVLAAENNSILMAGARCLRILASDAAKAFVWWSGDEKADPTKEAGNLLKTAEAMEQRAKTSPASGLELWEIELEKFGDWRERDLDRTEYLNGVD